MLATRSHFSLGESTLTTEAVLDEAKRVGATAIGLIDTMSISGMIDVSNRCTKESITPIIGCRLRLVDDITWRRVRGENKTKAPPEYWITWHVLSAAGLTALYRLLTKANDAEHFYETAKLLVSDVIGALSSVTMDDVAIVTSDVYSVVGHENAAEILRDMIDALSVENVYLQLTPIDLPYYDAMNMRALALAKELGAPTLVARPVLYPKDGADVQEVHQGILRRTQITDVWHWSNVERGLYALTDIELGRETARTIKRLRERYEGEVPVSTWTEGLRNTAHLVERVTYRWAKSPVSLPKLVEDEPKAVLAACKAGWSERFGRPVFGHRPDAEALERLYKPRLAYEFRVLRDLGFCGYFLLVQDLVRWAKDSGIRVGPGRGSVGGSLIAYLMGITDCDPIRFDLLFERFINPERSDLPDADLDFMSARRHEVIQYLADKYGTDRVAGISNYGQLKGASALRDVGRICGLSERDYACSKLVPKEHGQPIGLTEAADQVGEIAAFRDANADVWTVATSLEGVMRNLGRHAAGVVVAGCDLTERAVVERRSGEATVNWDKRIVEDQGLVKMDILGLETLDVVARALDYIRERHGKRINLMAIPLDDEAVLQAFAEGRTVGVFQFESGGMRRLLKSLGAEGITFEDCVAATALYRPGPMDSGMMDSYVNRKAGTEDVLYEHPKMADALNKTYGVMVYQEQVMQISRDLAGFSMAEADKLRKAMGKKDPKLMAEYRDKFVEGCDAQGTFDETHAGALFDKIAAFAGYGFNRSHSVEYTLISYQSMWLKVNYPIEFIAACLSLMKEDKLPALLGEAERLGIEVLPPNINQSSGKFEILTDTTLLIPFNRIKGISDNTTNAILEARAAGPFTSVEDLIERVERRKCNIKHRTLLEDVGAFADIVPGSLAARHPDRIARQKELMPGLVNAIVPIRREMTVDTDGRRQLGRLVKMYQDEGLGLVKPYLGRDARFMVITDAPTSGEERVGSFAHSESFTSIATALAEAGLARNDAYWTGLLKRPKTGSTIPHENIETFWPILAQEIAILKPPVILLLGNAVVRRFVPDIKGAVVDHAGKVVYDKKTDTNIIVGFNPGQIWFDPSKQEVLDTLFAQVSEIL
ncbi:DNA polymerase III subunit alpha [Roseospira marina]|nr:DNA polymerase III subunit alpha [Roseospira marina]MBB4315466.1 DNA polymerase-3 subunit alpha [Roseospira marina]MBB5088388.1 DNA polymerase-3 subunit alpha [Roseospira marina]